MNRWFQKECFRTLYFGVLHRDAPLHRPAGWDRAMRISDEKKPKGRSLG